MPLKAHLTSLFLAILLWPALASAHEAGFSGQIAATLHFRPDDRPVAREATDIRLIDLRSADGTFTAANCRCVVEIRQSGRLLATLPMKSAGSSLAATYTFPASGNYDLRLKGEPLPSAAFEPFSMDFHPHINRADGGSALDGLLLAGGAVVLAILGLLSVSLLRPRRTAI